MNMNEFDGKKFYGFSLHDDPVLSTTTRNFEFKYTRPEHLERLIQRVQQTDPEHERNRKKEILNRLCKAKKMPHNNDVTTAYRRDADIETHVSRGDASGRVRNLSDTEINQLIGKVKSYGDLRRQNSTDTYAKAKDTTKSMQTPMTLKGILRTSAHDYPSGSGTVESRQSPRQLFHPHEYGNDNCAGDGDLYGSEPTSEDQILCNPFDLPHEPLYETHTMHLPHMRGRELHSGLCKLPDVPEEDELLASKTVMPTVIEEFRQPLAKWVEICADPAMEKAQLAEIKFAEFSEKSERLPTNVTYTMHSHELQLPIQISTPEMMLKNMSPPPSLPNMALTYAMNSYDDNPSTYEIEDSDLEYELMERAQYTKYCGARPKTEELTNNSNGSGGLAEFVELESEIPNMNLSFLKNVSPLRYSDLTDDRDEDKRVALKQNQMKLVIKNRNTKPSSPTLEKDASIASKDSKKKCPKTKKKPAEEIKASSRKKSTARSPDISSPAEKSSLGTPRSGGKRSSTTTPRQHKERNPSQISSNELRSMKNIVLTKSIEDLKMEKMTIFAKMTSTQERIIEILDKLRISLLELYVPDSHYEKTRRQKNAFEFSVRFSRNFLYPLKGMIEDLRVVSVEQLCSAASNEATQRVLNIFTLIHQSLQTYYKQLRYFLLDQVPQKLNTLIELASTTVSICLEKQVFDRNDAIIECLQERCAKFLGFLEDMHEERFLTARDNYRKASFDKTASNYSLKMFMNDLNMYEPKLVPKNHYNHRRKPKLRRVLKPSTTNTKTKANAEAAPTPQTSQMVITKPDGDQISTHINELAKSSGLFQSAQNIAIDPVAPPAEPSMNAEEIPTLNKALIEALQTVTKEQMRQVLQPIMQTLGSVIEKKNATKTIEELLNAFSSNLISLAEGENPKRVQPEKYSGDGDRVRAGAEELKASKQTERQRNRHRQSNSESTKRNEAAAFFGGIDTAHDAETAIGELSADDNDDDNYYDDDGFENDDANGNDIDEDDDDGDDDGDESEADGNVDDEQARDAPTEPSDPSEPNEAGDSAVRYFRDGYNGKKKNRKSNKNNNNNNHGGSKIVVFDNFNLDMNGVGEGDGDGDADAVGDGDNVASESGSDFASFDGNSSSFDVVIAMKPDKNKVNEQQQLQQQQQQQQQGEQQQQQQQKQYNNKKEQQQHITEQQQLEKLEQQQQQQQKMHNKSLKLSKQQQQQQLKQLQIKPLQSQLPDRQQQKALRERTENYDTHIQQQQQLMLQQAYEEQLMHSQQLAKHDERRCDTKTMTSKPSAEQMFKQSNNLQKQLKQQLQEHQRCIIEQQQQQQLHQQQFQQQKMLDRKDEQKLQEKLKQPQPPPSKPNSLPPPKPLTRKQMQAQAQHQARSTISSRHTSRASTSRLPSSRVSPLRSTSRGLLSTRAKSLSSCRADLHAEKSKLLKKRRNPLSSPPPAPSATPTNSATRTPRSPRGSASAGCNATKVHPSTQQSPKPSHTNTNVAFYETNDVGAGGDTRTPGAIPLHAQSQMLQMCSMLKSEFVDMLIPRESEAVGNASRFKAAQAPEPRSATTVKCSGKALADQTENLANHDLIEALTNCLFKYNAAMKDSAKNVSSPRVATPRGVNQEPATGNPASPITLYTGESPYEKLKLKKAQQRLRRGYQKEQRRAERKLAQKGMDKDANKADHNDWEQEDSADELHNDVDDYELQTTNQQDDEMAYKNQEPLTSPCTLWNSNFKDIPRKKNLHIEELIAERDQFLKLCSKNRFYANPNFNQPWRVFSKLANRLSNDIIGVIEEDFSIGVSKFVQDFLDNETKI